MSDLKGFQRYLWSKKSVDDFAINQKVFEEFSRIINTGNPQKVLELGAGIGSMVQRLIAWLPVFDIDYTLMDLNFENINIAKELLKEYDHHKINGRRERIGIDVKNKLGKHFNLKYLIKDIYDFGKSKNKLWDGIIANAFFDLIDLERILPILYHQLNPGGWIYATINFDGETIFEPIIDSDIDIRIIDAYHQTMDQRQIHGSLSSGSQSGRKLYYAFKKHGFEIRSIGSSDWVVYPRNNVYIEDEKYFLSCILTFFEESLIDNPIVNQKELNYWLETRRKQLDEGELFYIAHQLDYLVIKPE